MRRVLLGGPTEADMHDSQDQGFPNPLGSDERLTPPLADAFKIERSTLLHPEPIASSWHPPAAPPRYL